jgi:thiol-disulfide isomerase/thioredoxin
VAVPTSRLLALIILALLLTAGAWAVLGSEPSSLRGGEATPAALNEATPGTEPSSSAADVPVLRPAPDLVELDGWLQTELSSLDEFEGKIVILQFWTFSCSNCKATIPNLQDIYATYGRDRVEIVGVHAPEFSFEENPDAILEAASDLGVTWPIALDTGKRNFHSWQEGPTAYWPRTYVIDADGQIRFDHIGEGQYDELRNTVAALVADL